MEILQVPIGHFGIKYGIIAFDQTLSKAKFITGL